MFELAAIATAFANLADPFTMLMLVAGIILGLVIGIRPGLGPPIAIALALPFTFYMDPITGILLLVGIYKGAIYGGSISAILIKTPGTPAASCTVLSRDAFIEFFSSTKARFVASFSLM